MAKLRIKPITRGVHRGNARLAIVELHSETFRREIGDGDSALEMRKKIKIFYTLRIVICVGGYIIIDL